LQSEPPALSRKPSVFFHLILILVLLLLLLSACDISLPQASPMEWPPVTVLGAPLPPSPTVSPPTPVIERPEVYAVQFETDISLALYEPADGCYIGAQTDLAEGLPAFAGVMGIPHAVYAFEMRIGDTFPAEIMLFCVAQKAVPFIILAPKDTADGGSFSLSEIQKLARQLNAYNTPLFVLFNPLSAKPAFDPETYTLYFRYARVVFQELAPKAAFVFGADTQLSAENLAAYYPGDNSVDWVAAYFNDALRGGGYDDKKLNDITAFYQTFHEEKPVVLVTGISHFSSEDYIYRTAEAAERINKFYEITPRLWPRVKLIIYRDMNDIPLDETRRDKILDDNSISREDELISAYRGAVANRRYAVGVNKTSAGDTKTGAATAQTGFRLSDYTALYAEGRVYIEEKVLHEMNEPIKPETIEMDEKEYFEALYLNGTHLYAVTDYENKLVTIYRRLDGVGG
jgi:hypothetical protein